MCEQAATINAETGQALILAGRLPPSEGWRMKHVMRPTATVIGGSSMLVPAGLPDAVLRALQPLLASWRGTHFRR